MAEKGKAGEKLKGIELIGQQALKNMQKESIDSRKVERYWVQVFQLNLKLSTLIYLYIQIFA